MVWKAKTKVIKRPQNTKWGKPVKVKYKIRKDGKTDTGRPTKKTPEVIKKLQEAYLYNCTDEEACAYAWISETALNDWKKKDEKFKERIHWAKQQYAFAIKRASYKRATNIKTKDSTEILFRIDKRYKEEEEKQNTTVTILDIARIMQEKRLARENWDIIEVKEDKKALDDKKE